MRKKFLLAVCLFYGVFSQAMAQEIPETARSSLPAPELTANSWVLMDYNTGWVLAEHNADERIEPASLSKLMTAYVVFNELKKGVIKLDDAVTISKKAWKTGGSRMFVEVDTQVSVEDLLKGMIIQSGNDASVALAEHVAGTEEAFATVMNDHAARLGMLNSNFKNAPGLPDPEHYSSARDLTILTSALIREFADYYKWYSVREFTYNDITQHNRNRLLARDPTVDGVKTGYTQRAGYCLVGSARKDGMRLIATVTGATKPSIRIDETHTLLKYGFASYQSKLLFDGASSAAEIPVYKGGRDEIAVTVERPLYVTVARGKENELTSQLDIPESFIAPISVGETLGVVDVSLAGTSLVTAPLIAMESVPEGSWWKSTMDSLLLWLQ